MSRPAVLVLLALVAACGDDDRPPPDPRCGMDGIPADQPSILCPTEVDLGCIPTSGATLTVAPTTTTCDGTPATVACTPASGSVVIPGTTSGNCTATAPSGATADCTFPIRYLVDGPPSLQCPDDVAVACTGPLTDVALDDAVAIASCSGSLGMPTSDGPTGGFPVGATTVNWSASNPAGGAVTCSVAVTVDDATAPTVDCSGATTEIIRTSPADPITVDTPPATDNCDDTVEVEIAPIPTGRGTTTVTAMATDEAGLTGSCTFDLTVLDLFAPEGFRVISAARAGDGSTDATLGWDPPTSADVTEVRLERATDMAGPWTAVMTLPATTITFTDSAMPSPRAFYRLVALGGTTEGGITDPVRALAVTATEYNIGGQSVPTIGFATSLFGVIRHPVDLAGGPYPLVVFLHGNHGNCRPPGGGDDECETRTAHECTDPSYTTTPNAHGYVYLQETLAAQGYVTASLSANALNCRNDYIPERTQLILEHLRRWRGWTTTGGAPFGTTFMGHVDLGRVALVGHSRGGEAVAGAATALEATPIPGVSLAAVFGIGSTDYHTPSPFGVPFATLLPGCDADVRTLESAAHYDRSIATGVMHPNAQVLYVGANHNYFNTEWRFDDNRFMAVCSTGMQVGGAAQRGMLEVVLSDWVSAAMLGTQLPTYVRAVTDTPPVIDRWAGRALDLRWSYASPMRRIVDDFAGAGAPTTNDLGGTNTFTGYTATITCTGTCAGNSPHVGGGVRLAWDGAAATGVWNLRDEDVTGYDALAVRFSSRRATINDGLAEHDFTVRVTDTAGTTAAFSVTRVGIVPHLYPSGSPREVRSTLRIPVAELLAVEPTLDLAHISTFELAMPRTGGNIRGSIWVADFDLATE